LPNYNSLSQPTRRGVITGVNNAMNYNHADLQWNIRETRSFFGSIA